MPQTTRWLVSAAVVAFGLALLVLAVPRTIGALVMLPARSAIQSFQREIEVPDERLDRAIAAQEGGIGWVGGGGAWSDVGFLRLVRAERMTPGAPEREALASAGAEATRTALALSPADANAWTRLALFELVRVGPSPAVAAFLRHAVSTAPYDRPLTLPRVRLLLRAWPALAPEDRGFAFQQIRFAWEIAPHKLTQIAVDTGGVNVVRAALFRSREDFEAFEKRLERVRRQRRYQGSLGFRELHDWAQAAPITRQYDAVMAGTCVGKSTSEWAASCTVTANPMQG